MQWLGSHHRRPGVHAAGFLRKLNRSMLANEDDQWQLSQLNQRIDRLQDQKSQLQLERVSAETQVAQTARRLAHLRLVRWVRSPMAASQLWPVGLLVVGPIVVGAFMLLALSLVTSSFAAGLTAFVGGAAAGAALFAWLLYRPADAVLPTAIEQAESENSLASARLKETVEQLTAAMEEQRSLVEERRGWMASGKVQRAALLQRAWKTMPEAEWEDFVVEVCRTLGYSVNRLPRPTVADANMLVELEGRSVAIVTQAEGHTGNSTAVQRALAGKSLHGCERCGVILNRRFTGAAQEFASRQGCTLVGLEEFPDFVMGTIQL